MPVVATGNSPFFRIDMVLTAASKQRRNPRGGASFHHFPQLPNCGMHFGTSERVMHYALQGQRKAGTKTQQREGGNLRGRKWK